MLPVYSDRKGITLRVGQKVWFEDGEWIVIGLGDLGVDEVLLKPTRLVWQGYEPRWVEDWRLYVIE